MVVIFVGAFAVCYLNFVGAHKSSLENDNKIRLKLSVENLMFKFTSLHTVDEFPSDGELISPFPCIGEKIMNNSGTVILLLGDSIDRYLVEDYCKKIEGNFTNNWGHGFHMLTNHKSSGFCQFERLKFGNMNLFGSEKVGPYYDLRKSINQSYDFTDTIVRIPQAIEQFKSLVGSEIDFILIRTEIWDLALYSNSSSHNFDTAQSKLILQNRTHIISRFVDNNLWIIDFIKHLSPNSFIGTHTVPKPSGLNLDLFDHFTNGVRYISHLTGIFLFDWNLQFIHLDSSIYLRDFVHPSFWYSAGFLEFVVKVLQNWNCKTNISS